MIGKTTMRAQIRVLAGVNGAGKSSIVGATIRDKGGEYYNPDEAAREIMAGHHRGATRCRDCGPRQPSVASRCTSSTSGSTAPTPTSSGCDKESAPAGTTFPKPTSAVATATA